MQLLTTHLFRFYLFLSNKGDRKVISNSSRLKILPNINKLSINDIEEGDKNVQDFLINIAPHTLKQFEFSGDRKNRLNVCFYLEGLHVVLKSTTRYVELKYCIRD